MTAHWWHAKAPIESMGIVLWNSFHSSGNCLERELWLGVSVHVYVHVCIGRVKVRRGLQWRGGGVSGRLLSVVRGLGRR